jgi:hypothetical protein
VTDNPAPKAKRKKAKPTPTPDPNRPIPQPYLALAPRPLSSQASQQPSNPSLVLPSSYRRPTTSQSQRPDAGPSTSRRREEGERFVSGLLAPPTVRAGASTSTGTRPAEGGRRRTDRLRQTGQGHAAGNASMTSLGHLGRIMESDTQGQGEDRNPTPAPRRRRRIVREVEDEAAGLNRRLTVSSREEGRAIGLARGASMRRLNVWDGALLIHFRLLMMKSDKRVTDDIDVPPENDEPPPPFPFPTSSSSRLPPTFTSQEQPPIPNSPPPRYETASAPPIPSIALPESETNRPDPENRPPSRASTRYESAPSSPVIAPEVLEGPEDGDEERNDRRMWNEDLLAGYSLEERVQREFARRGSKELGSGGVGNVAGRENASPLSESEGPVTESAEVADRPAEEPAAVTAVQPSPTANESSDPQPAATTPLATPPADLPAEEEATHVEPTIAESTIVEVPPDVGPASSTVTRSPVVPAVELDTSSMPTDEPAKSPAQKEAVSETPVESQVDVEPPSQPETVIHPTPPPVDSTAPKVPEVLGSIKPTEPVAELEITAPTPRPIPSASEVPEVSSPIKAVEPVAEPEVISPTVRPVIQSEGKPPVGNPVEPEIIKSSTRPSISSASAHRSLATLAESEEVNSTEPISTSAPTRKLTRGKAIRRSSSGLIKTLTPSSPSEVVAAPLFSAARFDFGKSQITESDRPFVHRASAPEVHSFVNDKRGKDDRRGDHGFKVLGGRRLGDPPLNPIKQKEVDVTNSGDVEVIPPHREAALLRRESILAKYVRPPPPPTSSMSKPLPPDPKISPIARRESLPSGPLIDFSDYDHDSISNTSHHPEIPGLVAANAELLELLEQEASLPQSSSQAASKAQLVEDLKAQLQSIGEESRERTPPPLPPRTQPITHVQGAIKKKPPPPPPPIRARNWTSGQKISIAETATSPITPRPSIRRPDLNEGSPTRKQPPPIPTRRPPPPPPQAPPLFRAISEVTSTTSSLFDGENSQTSTSTIAPLPPKPPLWRGSSSGKFDRSPQKPRGPRPAPPAPRRSWARVVSDHPLDRTHSEEVLSLNNVDDGDHQDELTSPTRSTSEMDLSRPVVRPRRVAEYTDLDVFVSRLEGSGREYEVSPIIPFSFDFYPREE